MRRRTTLAAVLPALALALLPAITGAPARAQVTGTARIPVFPGLTRELVRFRLDDGRTAVANVLSFSAADTSLELRPVLAQDRVPGLETVPSMGRRLLPEQAVAGINGGFWMSNPTGDPNGFLSLDRRLVSEAETQGAGPRGTLARRGDRFLMMDRLSTTVTIEAERSEERPVAAVNRFHRATPPYPDDTVGPVYLYTPDFGGQVTVEQLTVNQVPQPVLVLVVGGLVPRPSGEDRGTVELVSAVPGPVAIPRDGTVVVAHGAAATDLAGVAPGDEIRVDVEVVPADSPPTEWADLVDALAAGPLIVRRGERVDPTSWEDEGFAPSTHSNVRHPRSAVGLTFDGRVLLITVDGRQPDYSVGMTMHELSHFLRTLGVRDGLSLDGGASSQFVTDGVLRNRPCCDRELRPVATGLFVFHDYQFVATERIAGTGREATAAQVALAAYPDGAEEVVLAAAANFPDALAGGPLAHGLEAPLLLTGRDELPEATVDALNRLDPERITILGGPGAVGEAVRARLAQHRQVRRLSGKGRVETAIAIARAMGDAHDRVFLARADRFPDALSAAAPGAALGMPILLSGPAALPAEVAAYLRESHVREVVVLGGQTAVSDKVADELRGADLRVTRLAGKGRFGTAAAVNRWTLPQLDDADRLTLVVPSGATFPDALSGGPLAARRGQLLMIAPGQDVLADPEAKTYFDELAAGPLRRVTMIGGHSALSSYAQWQLDQLARR